jgi:hypothetical protein
MALGEAVAHNVACIWLSSLDRSIFLEDQRSIGPTQLKNVHKKIPSEIENFNLIQTVSHMVW